MVWISSIFIKICWHSVWKDRLFGPYFFDDNVTSEMDDLACLDSILSAQPQTLIFQQDNVPRHFATTGHGFFDMTFTVHWTAEFH
jgi:hypothetical protein